MIGTDEHQSQGRRGRPWLVAVAVLLVLGVIACGIVLSRRQATHQILDTLHTRASTSAAFLATFLVDQADRERRTASALLAGPRPSRAEFDLVSTSFGSTAAVLLDGSGRLLQVVPSKPALIGSDIAPHYAHLRAAEAGRVDVSNVVLSAADHRPIVAIATPYGSSDGRRVISLAYPIAGSDFIAFVEHSTSLAHQRVALVDGAGQVIAASPALPSRSFERAAPQLAAAVVRHRSGGVSVGGRPGRFVVVPVAGSAWHLVIAVPDRELFASIGGAASWLPWVVYGLLCAFGALVTVLYARSQAARRRLAEMTVRLAEAALTDPVTGLLNRRGLEERLREAVARSRRDGTPLSALMVDIDHFKAINDTRGHDAGDRILIRIGDCMRDVLRESDIYGRWGGDEFIVLLPATEADGARDAARRLSLAFADGGEGRASISIGASSTTTGDAKRLLSDADAALYAAKGARPLTPVPV